MTWHIVALILLASWNAFTVARWKTPRWAVMLYWWVVALYWLTKL